MEQINNISKKDWLFWSFFLFIFIYAPPLLPYTHLILGSIIFIIILLHYNRSYGETFKKSDINTWMKTMIAVFVYAILIPFPLSIFYNDVVDLPHYYHLFNRFAILIFMEGVCTTFLLTKFNKKNYNLFTLLRLLIGIAIIQSFLGCLAFMVPGIKQIFLKFMINMGGLSTENEGVILYRTFGFAGSMLDQFGYGTGLLAGISFFLGVYYKSRYILYSVIVILASLLNARSGIVIYIIAIFITLFFALCIDRKIKMVLKSIAFFILIPTVFVTVLQVVSLYNENTGTWINKGVESVAEFVTTGSSDQDNMNVITSDQFWQLPDGANVILGTGHSRYEAEGYLHTDNGLVNDIWFVGIAGLVLLYGVVILLCYRIFRNSQTYIERFISIFFICSFFVFDIKAASIGYNMGGAVFFLIVFATRYFQNKRYDSCKEVKEG